MPDTSFIPFTFGGNPTASVTGPGDWIPAPNNVQQGRKFVTQALGSDAARLGTVQIEGSHWNDAHSGAGPTNGRDVAFASSADAAASYRYYRANITAIGGTGTTVRVAGMGATL